jgi:hypothetical protein
VLLGAAASCGLVAGAVVAVREPGPGAVRAVDAGGPVTPTPDVTTPTPELSTPGVSTTTAVRPSRPSARQATPRATTPSPRRTPTTTRPAAPATRPAAPRRDISLYRGLGTWVDVYDYSDEIAKTKTVRPADVDEMAARGVRTLYLQASKEDPRTPSLITSPALVGEFLDRAHARGMKVVAWYLPLFVDTEQDWRRVQAMLSFRSPGGQRFDAIGIDIESREQADVDKRNASLVTLSKRLRAAAPGMALQAITLPPVVTDVINTAYWPRFPWKQVAPLYDVWSPMGYWTNRKPESGWRDAYRYTRENVRLTRSNLGLPGAVVHPVGGIGDQTTAADVDGFVRAARETGSIGGSVYDYATTSAALYPKLRGLPR